MSQTRGKNSDEHKSVFGNRPKDVRNNGGGADWSRTPSELLGRLIDATTSRGGAVRFGYTRDGGAYALGLYYGSESRTEYCRPTEDLDSFLTEWIEFYLALPMSNGVSPSQGK